MDAKQEEVAYPRAFWDHAQDLVDERPRKCKKCGRFAREVSKSKRPRKREKIDRDVIVRLVYLGQPNPPRFEYHELAMMCHDCFPDKRGASVAVPTKAGTIPSLPLFAELDSFLAAKTAKEGQ